MVEICDYEGSRYRTEFWEGQGREYEDRAERIALRKLLPPHGRRLIEIGAGYGRLADLYQGYDEVLLLDYALSQLQQARGRLGNDRFHYIAADLYHRKQHAELHGILKTSAAWIVMVVLPGAVFLAFFASEVMGTFGKDFPAGYVALAILAAAQIVNCTFGSVDYLFAMAAKQWIAVIDLSVFALASMGLTFWLAPRYGVVGAAVAGAIGLLGPRATRVVEVAVLMRMNPFGAGHLRIAACVIPSALLALVWREVFAGVVPAHAFWWLFAPAYVVLYLALLPVLAREELNGLLSVVRRRRRRGAPTEEPQPAPDELPPPSTSPSADEDVAD